MPIFTPFTFIAPPIVTGGGGDADATAYLAEVVNQGGTVDATITSAVNTLFTDLKAAGIYSKLVVMYPFIGGVANAHSINALDPISGSAHYFIEWVGPWTHSSNGAQGNGSSTGANTWLENSVDFPTFADSGGNRHICVYTNADSGVTTFGYDWGGGAGFTNFMAVNYGGTSQYSGFGAYTSNSQTSNTGFYTGQITGSRQSNFKNGSEVGFNTGRSDQSTNHYMSIGCDNRNAVPGFGIFESTDKRYAFAAAGAALTTTENSDYSTAVTAFQTALSRN